VAQRLHDLLRGIRLTCGVDVKRTAKLGSSVLSFRAASLGALALTVYVVFLWFLRHSSYTADPLLDAYIDMGGSLIAFTFAANALVRFRGTRDRISLILAFGFVLAGLIEAGTGMAFYRNVLVRPSSVNYVSLAWLAGRTLLGVLLLVALAVEKRIPVAREPGKEIAAATLIVGVSAYLTSVLYFTLPGSPRVHPHAFIPRAWDFVPAMIYLAAAIGFGLRVRQGRAVASLDRALYAAAVINVIAHVTISQSLRGLDAAYTVGHLLIVLSYVVVLAGTLLDNAQLFDQVSRMAASDSLTGLANHRQMLEVLESEIQRSRRTGRSFGVLLFDLDGLKKINDRHGHLTGTRAIKRLGNILGSSSRSIDTAARYGGDEFALVLPESGAKEADRAASRICKQLAQETEEPHISVSVGRAVYPTDGATVEQLLAAADVQLYKMKGRHHMKLDLRHVAACL
jgi:diguanylate cyclase (GGDEF)-like protein